LVKVEHLSKSYNGNPAIKDLTFNLRPGKIYGLLGKNGAGKSTTMNIMTGYLSADSGSVSVDGFDILKDPIRAKEHIGYLPEIPPVYTDMTVTEYLKFVIELKKVEKQKRKFELERVIKLTGLESVSNKLIKNLSKGYRQRVGIAEALVGDPELIVLDEPTVGLDPEQIIEIRNLIASLKEKHIVILSSHILSEVSEICDNIIIINDGKLIVNTEASLLSNYVHQAKTLVITAQGDRNKAVSSLKSVKHVVNVIADEAGEDTYKYTVTIDTDKDIRADISKALSSKDVVILEMKQTGNELEDMFLEITKESDEEEKRLKEELEKEAESEEADEADAKKEKKKKKFFGKKDDSVEEKSEKSEAADTEETTSDDTVTSSEDSDTEEASLEENNENKDDEEADS